MNNYKTQMNFMDKRDNKSMIEVGQGGGIQPRFESNALSGLNLVPKNQMRTTTIDSFKMMSSKLSFNH